MYVGCGSTFSKKEAEQRGFDCEEEKQEYKVTGSSNRQPENTWNK